jgi:hypothetical protein
MNERRGIILIWKLELELGNGLESSSRATRVFDLRRREWLLEVTFDPSCPVVPDTRSRSDVGLGKSNTSCTLADSICGHCWTPGTFLLIQVNDSEGRMRWSEGSIKGERLCCQQMRCGPSVSPSIME